MYEATITAFAKLAERKLAALREAPLGFFIARMLAGAYVGVGILVIFTLGSQVPKEFQKLVMGATFARRSEGGNERTRRSGSRCPDLRLRFAGFARCYLQSSLCFRRDPCVAL